MPDNRSLSVKVLALARRFEAQANGYAKRAAQSLQDEQNARTDAAVLFEAAKELEKK